MMYLPKNAVWTWTLQVEQLFILSWYFPRQFSSQYTMVSQATADLVQAISLPHWEQFPGCPWFDDSDKSPDEAAIPLLDIPRKNKIRIRIRNM